MKTTDSVPLSRYIRAGGQSGSGGLVMTTKMGATALLLGSLLGFWLGTSSEPVALDKAAIIALGARIAALAGYLWKQCSNFRNRKLKYTQALTENLYFKLLDNSAGAGRRKYPW